MVKRLALLGGAGRAGAAMLLRSLAQAALLVMLARQLGSAVFGNWVAATSLALLAGMLASMGMGYLVLLRSGQGAGRGRRALAAGLPWVLWSSGLLLLVYALLGTVLFGDQLSLAVLMCVGLAEVVFAAPTLLLALRLQGSGYPGSAQALYIVPPALRLLPLLLAALGGQVLAVSVFALWYLLAAMLTLLLAWHLCRRQQLLPRRWDWWTGRAHIRAALPYLPTRLCAFGATEVDKILAPLVLSSALAGSYALASRAAGFAMVPVHAALAAAQPQLSALARSDRRMFARSSRAGLLMALCYGVLAAAVVATMAAPVMDWLTSGRYPALHTAFQALALALVPMSLRHAAGGILLPLGKPLLRVLGELLGMAALCLSLPWLAGFGLQGMGWALLLSESMALCVLLVALLAGLRHGRR